MAESSSKSSAVFGSTGLVGSFILSNILADGTNSPVHTITRRAPESTSSRLQSIVEADTDRWAATLSNLSPSPSIVLSAIGTTRAAAGGLANQWKIDHDLNVELAKAAKACGATTFVFVSSGGTRAFPNRFTPYCKMKNGVEDAIRELDFQQAIILKPGVILGQRQESRTAESLAQNAVRGLGKLHTGLQDTLGQDAQVIARAAVKAAQLAEQGKAPSRYWTLDTHDIVRLGRTEWQEQGADKPGQDGSKPSAA